MQQNIALWILVLLVIWFMFFRKKSDYCGACGGSIA